jgi:hypothetical protein
MKYKTGKNYNNDTAKVITPEFRLSFPALFEKKAFEDSIPRYEITMLFDPNEVDVSPIQKAIDHVIKEKWKGKPPKKLLIPLKDGDEKELEGYAGMKYLAAWNRQRQPSVIDSAKNEIFDPQEIQAGYYCRAIIRAFAYENKFNKGVAFALEAVQLVREGETFGAPKANVDDFDTVGGEESKDPFGEEY